MVPTSTIANLCFSIVIAKKILNGLDPKTMAKCKNHSDQNKWMKVIKVELSSLADVIPTPQESFLFDLN
jgi:hypothetical protein